MLVGQRSLLATAAAVVVFASAGSPAMAMKAIDCGQGMSCSAATGSGCVDNTKSPAVILLCCPNANGDPSKYWELPVNGECPTPI